MINFRTNKYYLLILLAAFVLRGCGNFSGNYYEIESSTSTESSSTYVGEQMGGSFQGVELSLSTVVTTLAGTGSSGSANGTGTSASFSYPSGITTDGTNLYVADEINYLIRQIE